MNPQSIEESGVTFQVFVKDLGYSDDHWEPLAAPCSTEKWAIDLVNEARQEDTDIGEAYDYKIVKIYSVTKDHKMFLASK